MGGHLLKLLKEILKYGLILPLSRWWTADPSFLCAAPLLGSVPESGLEGEGRRLKLLLYHAAVLKCFRKEGPQKFQPAADMLEFCSQRWQENRGFCCCRLVGWVVSCSVEMRSQSLAVAGLKSNICCSLSLNLCWPLVSASWYYPKSQNTSLGSLLLAPNKTGFVLVKQKGEICDFPCVPS